MVTVAIGWGGMYYGVTVVAAENWVFLVYQLPREPSTPRITVWRRLKRLGVAQLSDGLVALPHDASTKEQLEWVAHEITEAGGTATIWITTPTVRRFGRTLAESLAAERAAEYGEVAGEAGSAFATEPGERSRALRRLRAEYRRIERRDYFPPPEQDEARELLERLADSLGAETIS
jgi:phosphoglycolate phosphatase-like HAD superfamily hydrolase